MSIKTDNMGAFGFAAVLALSRIFSETALLPGVYVEYGMQRFTAVVLSFLLAALLYVPLLVAAARNGGALLPDAAPGRRRMLSGFVGAVTAVYLLFCAAETGLRSHYYTSSTAFDSAPSAYFYIFVGAALLFAVSRGIKATVRAGALASAGALLLLALITAALVPDIKTDRLYPSLIDRPDGLAGEVLDEFSRSSEILLFAVLCGKVRGRPERCAGLYLLLSCGVIVFMTFLYNTVFGRLLSLLDYPFYTLSSVSDITLLHRINGIDVMIWVSAAIVRLALFTFAFRETVRTCFTAGRAADICGYVFAVAALLLSELFTAFPELYEPLKKICGSGIPLAAAVLLITALSAVSGRSGRHSGDRNVFSPAAGAGKRSNRKSEKR